jgi:hypothetical protein
MTSDKIYSLFKRSHEGPEYLTNISAKSLLEAKMKATIQFRDEEMFLVEDAAFKKIRRVCKH